MSKLLDAFCYTDKDVLDAFMGAKQAFSLATLLELGRDRGVFYSPRESREELAANLALLAHDFAQIEKINTIRDFTPRAERRQFATLNTASSVGEIHKAFEAYKENAKAENVVLKTVSNTRFVAKIQYTEIDYAKTRLYQRQEKEDEIEFTIESGETRVRMPDNSKAVSVLNQIRESLQSQLHKEIAAKVIDLSHVSSPKARTDFFLELMSKLPDYKLEEVTHAKIEATKMPGVTLGVEDDEPDSNQPDDTVLASIQSIALSGRSILAATEYKQLEAKGFFITSVKWKSKQKISPFDMLEFEAGFADGRAGKGFSYSARRYYRFLSNGKYAVTPKKLARDEQAPFLSLLESTAQSAVNTVMQPPSDET